MKNHQQAIGRRTFLQVGCAGMAGLSLPAGMTRLARAEEESSTADAVLFLNLLGGPSHLDTFDIKPEGPADTKGSFGNIQTRIPGLSVCEYLPKYAANADRYALIRGIAHSTGDHPQGQEYIATGNRPTPALRYPSIGSIVSREMPGNGGPTPLRRRPLVLIGMPGTWATPTRPSKPMSTRRKGSPLRSEAFPCPRA